MNNPLVTCVCPTMKAREQLLMKALKCFLGQTYARAELLIVTDSEDVALDPPPSCIRFIGAPKGLRLGSKRNFANQNALGEIICHWDDDDYSAPGRIAAQVERLRQTGLAATGYSRMRFTDGAKWYRYADSTWPLGTSLCYRKDWWERNHFDETVDLGSDTLLIYALQKQKQVDVVDCGDMMFARDHGKNLNKRSFPAPGFEPAEAMCFA